MGKNKFGLSILLIISLIVFVPSCNKDDDPVTDTSGMTEDEAADAMASSLGGSSSTNGFSAQMEEMASFGGGAAMDGPGNGNQVNGDTVITRQRSGTYSFNYTLWLHWSFPAPGIFQISYSVRGMYDTPRMSSNDSANASFTIANLLTGTAYEFNGTYLRLGTQISKVRNRLSFASTLSMTASNIMVNKGTKRIQSGTATLNFSGTASNGRSFSYQATVTFTGNQQATMVINSKTFNVNLTLGEATPA